MTRLIKLFFSPHVPRLRNLVEHLSRRLASLEIIVAELHILQIEDLVHAHVELASQQPPEDVVRTLQQLLARHRVVVELGARHERALLDVAQRRGGGNCSRRVSEAHEDATTCERVQRNLPSRSSDSIDDALHALSSRDLLHLRDDVDARVAGAGVGRAGVIAVESTRGVDAVLRRRWSTYRWILRRVAAAKMPAQGTGIRRAWVR